MGDELNIITDAATTEIYTQMGVLVETLDNPEMEYLRLVVDTADYPTGIYFVKSSNGDVRKLVKK